MKLRHLLPATALAWLLGEDVARALEIELGAQSLATLSVDDQTRAGGVGLAVEVGVPLAHRLLGPTHRLVPRAGVGALVGSGLAWSLEIGAAYRYAAFTRWQPDVGLSVLWLGGDLVRTIDAQGRVAGDPWALRLCMSPLRFPLNAGWVSLLALRAGPTLFRSGHPPLSLSVTLFEVGTEL